MSSARKRLRPLDPGEERAIHTTDPLLVTSLDDERSYCFSWPTAPLTAWINGNLAYTEAHIYKSAAAAAAAAAASSSGVVAGLAGSAAAAAATAYQRDDGTGAISRGPVATPPVFNVRDLLSSCFGRSMEDNGKEDTGGLLVGGLNAKSDTPSISGNSLSTCEDMVHLLAPFAAATEQRDAHPPALIEMPPTSVAQRTGAHPLCPPRPLCTGEDSIFTLNEMQLRDAIELGLIACNDHDEEDRGCGPSWMKESAATSQRQQLEWEVTGLEWRAYRESQRTGSALQRLLSLEAAVPFDPHGGSSKSSGNTVAATGNRSGSPMSSGLGDDKGETHGQGRGTTDSAATPPEWRERVYRLWLRWRLRKDSPRDLPASSEGDAPAGTTHNYANGWADASAHPSSPSSAYPPSHRGDRSLATGGFGAPPRPHHPWGAPLMPGAYLYDTQPDYFLNPARTSALQGSNPMPAGRDKDAHGTASALANARRRRGPYNFLCWKIEHYVPQLQPLLHSTSTASDRPHTSRNALRHRKRGRPENTTVLVSSEDDGGDGGSGSDGEDGPAETPQLTLEHPAFAPVPTRRQRQRMQQEGNNDGSGSGSTGAALLNAQAIDALIGKVVLSRPLVELELDGDTREERLRALEWTDLRRDTEMWRMWLSKMEGSNAPLSSYP